MKREEYGVLFRRLIVRVAGELRRNDPNLTQSEAHRAARSLVKQDWKNTKKDILVPNSQALGYQAGPGDSL